MPSIDLLDDVVRYLESHGCVIVWVSETGLVVIAEVPEHVKFMELKRTIESRFPGTKVMAEPVFRQLGFRIL